MTLAEFIDLCLTPIGGGIGAFIAARYVLKRPEFTTKVALGIGIAVAVALFATKVVTR